MATEPRTYRPRQLIGGRAYKPPTPRASYRHLYKTPRWYQLSVLVRREEPLCRTCLKEGRTKATQVCDHIVPHKGDERLFYERANLQGLCKRCHDRKTANEDGGFGRKRA